MKTVLCPQRILKREKCFCQFPFQPWWHGILWAWNWQNLNHFNVSSYPGQPFFKPIHILLDRTCPHRFIDLKKENLSHHFQALFSLWLLLSPPAPYLSSLPTSYTCMYFLPPSHRELLPTHLRQRLQKQIALVDKDFEEVSQVQSCTLRLSFHVVGCRSILALIGPDLNGLGSQWTPEPSF